MPKTKNLPQLTTLQYRTAVIVLDKLKLSATGEVSAYDVRTAGAHVSRLADLVKKGVLSVRYGDFEMPAGPYKGETLTNQPFYSLREN